MNNRFPDAARIVYTNAIRDLSYKDHMIELKQFLIEMTELADSKMTEIYIKLDEQLSFIEKGE